MSITEQKSIYVITRFLLPSLTKSERRAAEYLLANGPKVADMTLAEYAEMADSSQTSVLRFCSRLGVGGFSELREQLLMSKDNGGSDMVSEVSAVDTMSEILEKVFSYHIQSLKDTLALVSEQYDLALQALAAAPTIHFFGLGDAVVPGQMASIKFRRVGVESSVLSDPDMQVITACHMKKGEVAVAVSHTGRTRPIIQAMRYAKEAGATTICVTAMEKSPLIKYCDIKLFTAAVDLSVGRDLVARRIAEQAILEALYLGVITKVHPDYRDRLRKIAAAVEHNKM
jgi:Transcriptional regulators